MNITFVAVGFNPQNRILFVPPIISACFRLVFTLFSTRFCATLRFFSFLLVFFDSASKILQLLITAEACCHFAPPTRGLLVTLRRRQEACCKKPLPTALRL
jgi:hypothetical protein